MEWHYLVRCVKYKLNSEISWVDKKIFFEKKNPLHSYYDQGKYLFQYQSCHVTLISLFRTLWHPHFSLAGTTRHTFISGMQKRTGKTETRSLLTWLQATCIQDVTATKNLLVCTFYSLFLSSCSPKQKILLLFNDTLLYTLPLNLLRLLLPVSDFLISQNVFGKQEYKKIMMVLWEGVCCCTGIISKGVILRDVHWHLVLNRPRGQLSSFYSKSK